MKNEEHANAGNSFVPLCTNADIVPPDVEQTDKQKQLL